MDDLKSSAEWAFNIDDLDQGIHRTLSEGIETRIFCGENVMLSVVQLEPNSAGEVHSHPEEQWGLLLDGKCTRIQNGEEIEMQKGDFWCTPANVVHGIRTGDVSATVVDIFSPPRDAYRTGGKGFSA